MKTTKELMTDIQSYISLYRTEQFSDGKFSSGNLPNHDMVYELLSDIQEYMIYGPVEEQREYSTFEEYWKAILPALWNVREWNNERIKAWIECAFTDSRR